MERLIKCLACQYMIKIVMNLNNEFTQKSFEQYMIDQMFNMSYNDETSCKYS